MHVKRFIAPSMQEALKQVREALGADAMILSTRKVGDRTEVVCALDYDPDQARQEAPVAQDASEAEVARRLATRRSLLDEEIERAQRRVRKAEQGQASQVPRDNAAPAAHQPAPASSSASVVPEGHSPVSEALAAMQSEIAALKALLAETHGGGPVAADPLQERLEALGVSASLAESLLGRIKGHAKESRWNEVLAHLARAIPICDVEKSVGPRAIALLGPTGAGKTTTLAKLAARHIKEHGREGLVLITTDRYRVAASGQLQALGKLLGVPVHVVTEKQRLASVLDALMRPRLVLIDTAGLTASDPNGIKQLRELAECPHRIEKYLVISAVSQAQVMKSNYHYYKMPGLSGCMITKVDEACALGQALELSIQEHLPVACYTDGQNVARDFHPASGHSLVARAVALSRQASENAPMSASLAG